MVEIVIVDGSFSMPEVHQLLIAFFDSKKLSKGFNLVHLMSALACGAAVQGSILLGNHDQMFSKILLIDVLLLCLGIENVGGIMAPLIKRNSAIPTLSFVNCSRNSAQRCIQIVSR
jgi:heat shock protein 1/8